ncbi:hypothetical protein WOB87_22755 [Vibrio parahaemolyticus]|nr:hypothetical protein [Vibrio parahaemolyticus]
MQFSLLDLYPIQYCDGYKGLPGSAVCESYVTIESSVEHLIRRISMGSCNASKWALEEKFEQLISPISNQNIDMKNKGSVFYDYRFRHPVYNPWALTREIEKIGSKLAQGQLLFHGGDFKGISHNHNGCFVTELPLSTTLSPDIAVYFSERHSRNHGLESYKIQVLKVATTCQLKAVLFTQKPPNGLGMANEMELLLSAGAKIEINDERVHKDLLNRTFTITYCTLL